MIARFEAERYCVRTIVHIDMDAFYAAVEMRDNVALRKVPMAVGGESMLVSELIHASLRNKCHIITVDVELRGTRVWCACSNAWLHCTQIVPHVAHCTLPLRQVSSCC